MTGATQPAHDVHDEQGMRDLQLLQAQCDRLAASILKDCESCGIRIASAESLTGGLLADSFIRIPGASNVFLGSAVTYDLRAKASILHVDRALLDREGAVHPEVARQMASGVVRLYGQPEYGDRVIGLSTTGVAGPGPDGSKPAGLVYVGVRIPAQLEDDHTEHVSDVELHLTGSREMVRRSTVFYVLQNLSVFTATFKE